MGSANGIISVAYDYLGMDEDDPRFEELIDYYNEHTDGYDMKTWDEWCACFVSVCALKSNNEDATGTSVNCAVFRQMWRDMGIYHDPWEAPDSAWLIEYDWDKDGIPDHIGIVVDCDGGTIHVIEGNMDEMCAERWIPVGWEFITCFGAPDYDGQEEYDEEDELKYIYNFGGPCHRLYNPFDGDHFFTLSDKERDDLVAAKWIYEGVAFETRRGGSDAVYRFFNSYDGDHVWTPFYDEACKLQEAGWKYEGVSFFAWGPGEGGTEVHRLYNEDSHDHILIANEGKGADEIKRLTAIGWVDEFSFAV